jgi:hypothetical protein
MRVLFHPEFPKDIRRFEAEYAQVSAGLAMRFRDEVDQALEAIKSSPTRGGHFLSVGASKVAELRRRNLKSFPFFVLYGLGGDQLFFGAIIPSRSDPLTWLARFVGEKFNWPR